MSKARDEYNIISLSDDLKYWRAERPDEWTMDRFITMASELEQQKAELIECLEKSIRLLEDRMCDFCDEDFCDIMSDCILQELKQYLSKYKTKTP